MTYDAKETLRIKVLESQSKALLNRIQEKDYIQQHHVEMIDDMLRECNALVQECCYINDEINLKARSENISSNNESQLLSYY